MRRKRKKLDWDPGLHEKDPYPSHQFRSEIGAAIGIFGLFKKSIDAEDAYAQRCPKCDRHALVRVKPGVRKSPWKCNNCGNDSDEFGNKL